MAGYAHDNRWSPGASGATVPDDARAAYSARWIDNGDHERADMLPDRQGFAYSDPADRDELINHLMRNDYRIRMMGCDNREVSFEVDLPDDGFRIFQRRAGGYVYVDAWLTGESA